MTSNETQKMKEIFSERLEEFIGAKSLTEWSKEVGLPSTTVTNWKLKKSLPQIDYLYYLSKKLGVSIDYLVGLEEA